MLPGFRFLVAATLLTVSLLVFGLGAAALLRASHERFAGLPKQPAPAPVVMQSADSAPPTLSLLRVEPAQEAAPVDPRTAPEPVQTPPFDTLLPTDRVASLTTARRVEEASPPPLTSELQIEVKPEAKVEASPERPEIEPKVELKVERAPEPLAEIAMAPITQADPPVPVTAPAPADPVAASKIEESVTGAAGAIAIQDQVPQTRAALPEPDVTGTVTAIAPTAENAADVTPPLVNARPIRRPPLPRDRPVIAALPDPVLSVPAAEAEKPVVRRRRPVVKRVAKPKRRIVVTRPTPQRPAAQTPSSPFGASPFGT